MKIKTSYVANDGTEFDTESKCRDYEARTSKIIADELAVVHRVCKFFNAEGKQIQLDYRFDESDVYGVRISCPAEEANKVMTIFGKHFDDLYFALEGSNFQTNCEVILVYDWTGSGRGWMEIDLEHQEWFCMVAKVMEGA